ncbi:glycopeptide antibiotics resistance protein [Conyzicola lurida]|uniref:Glycopeptide antibiotics resistance protein n=1 Tax=Conyzicola lurida TaxID=1172621 RepID=A0A841APP8_9MICO|nr:glycopeptide antibiotics resistance protein [Conyzicola lurida]
MFRRHPLLSLLTVVYLAGLAWVTLTPSANSERAFSLLGRLVDLFQRYDSTDWVTWDRAEFIANIVLFMPMGVFVVLLLGRRRWWAAIVVGLLASCWIELAQSVWLPDRVSDPRDLASNTLGTCIGVLGALVITWPAAVRDRRTQARTARQAGV